MTDVKDPSDTGGRLIAASKVNGTSVYNTAGEKLGSVYDVMLDKSTGKTEYAIIQLWWIPGNRGQLSSAAMALSYLRRGARWLCHQHRPFAFGRGLRLTRPASQTCGTIQATAAG